MPVKVSLIIPTLNEEKNLGKLLKKIPNFVDKIIIVDGYSEDRTVDIAKMIR
ncbi:MAG TPA: glycosyltransferase [Candidatus Atribacteria bacterium]|nr:glycosyltransferase [Candidatus Atribacteria bacterium]